MTRLEKAREKGMLWEEVRNKEACPADYKVGPEMDEETVCNRPIKGVMQLHGCRGKTCHKCWNEEYTK